MNKRTYAEDATKLCARRHPHSAHQIISALRQIGLLLIELAIPAVRWDTCHVLSRHAKVHAESRKRGELKFIHFSLRVLLRGFAAPREILLSNSRALIGFDSGLYCRSWVVVP
jgi:hypothetical protein